jgi:hypothetical protein
MSFKKELRRLGMKVEGTPYTADTLTASDFDMRVDQIEYDPDIMITARKLALGTTTINEAIVGKRSITVKFRAELYPAVTSGDGTVVPAYVKAFQACGWLRTDEMIGSDVGVNTTTIQPHSGCTAKPVTIMVQEIAEGVLAASAPVAGIFVKAHGCMGAVTIKSGKVGEPVYAEFEFKGAFDGFVAPSGGSIILVPDISDTEPCSTLINATVQRNSYSQVCDKISISTGLKVELYTNGETASGYGGGHVAGIQDISVELDPDMQALPTENFWTEMTTHGTYAEFRMQINGANQNSLVISVPKAQLVQAGKPGEREGHVIHSVKLRGCANNGDDALVVYLNS